MNNWIPEIDSVTAQFKNTFGALSQDELNWKLNAQTWSIAQNIDHLIAINNSYFPIIESVKNGTFKLPFLGKIGFIVSLFGKMILSSVQPDRKRKAKTFPVWEPAKSKLQPDILERFEASQEQLKKIIKDSAGLVEKGVVISSPANKNIVYKLETAFDIIVAHEKRHFEQAKEVLQMMKK